MSNKLKLEESLSALMDNEVDDLELRRILKEIPENSALKQKWQRYHLVSATLRQETHSNSSVNLLTAIQLELASEPAYSAQSVAPSVSRFAGILGQGAIAASVALVVLISVGSFKPAGMERDVAVAEMPANNAPILNGDFMASEFSRVVSYDGTMDDAARDRLKQAVYQVFKESDLPAK